MRCYLFNIRNDDDYIKYYPILYKWWKDWGFTPLAPDMLSKNGIIIYKDNTPICAGWLFSTDSNTAIAGWLISTKDDKGKRKGCIEELIKRLELLANNLGFDLLNFPASNPFLSNKLEKLGFGDYADKNITNYFKRIDGRISIWNNSRHI